MIGYTQPITDSEFNILSKKGYRINDLIGRTGIEFVYEDYIRGEWGGEMIEVNSSGTFKKSLGTKPSKQGKDVELTIDLNLQLIAEGVLKDKRFFEADRILAKHDENYMPPELKNILSDNAK